MVAAFTGASHGFILSHGIIFLSSCVAEQMLMCSSLYYNSLSSLYVLASSSSLFPHDRILYRFPSRYVGVFKEVASSSREGREQRRGR